MAARKKREGYKIRVGKVRPREGEEYKSYSITVPPAIAEMVPDGTMFLVEATEEGILYRRIVPKQPRKKPSWAKENKS